ncbi:MAG: phosphoadenosine phosphosulfate reductase family protein [Chloroflexi bacterium]|nr:phosphoadenosine phosphosulfate reductase family protein [Chloroflexota bacterium]
MSAAGLPTRHVLSYGGGVNTVALMLLLIRNQEPLDEVVFADTGVEVPETYAYMEITRDYLERYGIPFHIIRKRNGKTLYETCEARRVFPSAIWRWSTRDFKVHPILGYYRSLGTHVNQYLGIAHDEIWRMKDSPSPYVTNLYPLIDKKMTRADCVALIEAEGLPVPVKSGCFFCPFNSIGRWKWLYETHPELFQKAVVLEEQSKHFPAQRLTDQVFREKASVKLRDLASRFADGELPSSDPSLSACGGECMT